MYMFEDKKVLGKPDREIRTRFIPSYYLFYQTTRAKTLMSGSMNLGISRWNTFPGIRSC